jgi:c(7)-type cytochrome triheme protein
MSDGRRHWLVLALAAMAALCAVSVATARPPAPARYGTVVLETYSRGAGIGAVVFDHWLHRSRYTCRLCHVDLGFAMAASATDVKASTNRAGHHCGACHNGTTTYLGEPIFAACSSAVRADDAKECQRCHSLGKRGVRKRDYETETAKLPKTAWGVNWEEAEARGLIEPLDVLEGVSVRRMPLKVPADFTISARGSWMPNILFSHRKHAIWNGCEGCHPEIFPTTKKGTSRYTMFQIAGGEYCGVCHGSVAFPLNACERCHTLPVGR